MLFSKLCLQSQLLEVLEHYIADPDENFTQAFQIQLLILRVVTRVVEWRIFQLNRNYLKNKIGPILLRIFFHFTHLSPAESTAQSRHYAYFPMTISEILLQMYNFKTVKSLNKIFFILKIDLFLPSKPLD